MQTNFLCENMSRLHTIPNLTIKKYLHFFPYKLISQFYNQKGAKKFPIIIIQQQNTRDVNKKKK